MTTTITPQQLAELRTSGQAVDLIDVRTPVEFQEVHVDFARNLPLDQLRADSLKANQTDSPDPSLYIICRSGSRGRQACERLEAAGLNVVNVEGGTMAWEAAGLPLVRTASRVMSLERQVRVGAGAMVVAGVLLGATIHPSLYAISAFVGAGLVFAGITDTCGMGMMLAKMPWNRSCGSTDGAACSSN